MQRSVIRGICVPSIPGFHFITSELRWLHLLILNIIFENKLALPY